MQWRNMGVFAIATIGAPSIAFGDAASVNAINAVGLKRPDGAVLTGAGVNIGQVESARAAVHGFDSAVNTHPSIIPFESRNAAGQIPAGPMTAYSLSTDLSSLES